VPQVILLEAAAGPLRRQLLQQWLTDNANSTSNAVTSYLVSGDFKADGIWAGLSNLLQQLVPQIEQEAPSLLQAHNYELCLILPSLRQSLQVSNPSLTDTSDEDEKVRNYPIDRAYRSLHGVINLLTTWQTRHEKNAENSANHKATSLVLVCDGYDLANSLVQRFYVELMRRRGKQLNLTLLLATEPGQGQALLAKFDAKVAKESVQLDLPKSLEPIPTPSEMSKLAEALEQELTQDAYAKEMFLPKLITYWLQSEQPAKALQWQIEAMHIYNHRGLYEVAAIYGSAVEAGLATLNPVENGNLLGIALGSLYFVYVPLGQAEKALQVMLNSLDKIANKDNLPRPYYMIAMLYARFVRDINYPLAEDYLQRGLDLLASSTTIADDEKYFLTVFILNGLAFVRQRQRQPQAAIELCQRGVQLLNEHLKPDQHRLHRSVLLYNIAQVYAVTGPFEEAVRHLSAAMEMDPNYSEYYNDRGSIYLKTERIEEAMADYHKAIELSPPYPEPWTNLGQCYRILGQMEEAVAAYAMALDLNPDMGLALVGQAEALAELDRAEEALVLYDKALLLEPKQPAVLANRAILHYTHGALEQSLADLNHAIALAPEMPELYQNRAVALADLGRNAEAVADLQAYLQLNPLADDLSEVESQLAALI
jgi:tetratricopeptide (TPR) repeat protein